MRVVGAALDVEDPNSRRANLAYDQIRRHYFSERRLMKPSNFKWRSAWMSAFTLVCTAWHTVEHFFEPWLALAGM